MMISRKEWMWVALALVLGLVYAVCFSGWFGPKVISVQSSVRSLRSAWNSAGQRADVPGRPLQSITFTFPKKYRLTSVRVVSLDEFVTNKNAASIWHLVSKSGSKPVRDIVYGAPIPGMVALLPGIKVQPLQAGGQYRLFVEAGSYKGTNDFFVPGFQNARR